TFGLGNIVVSGNAGGPWDVGFRNAFASQDVPPLVVGVNEVQSIQLQSPAVGGAFTLDFNGQVTAPIPFNASALQLQTALENLSHVTPGDVAVAFDPVTSAWFVTFQGQFANQTVPTLIGHSDEFQRIPSPVPGGALTLSFNGQVTSLIQGNATA